MSGPRPGLASDPRGAITWVTLLLLAGVIGGGYLFWVWGPIYYENLAVKQVARDFMNQAVKNGDDAYLRRAMVARIRSLVEVEAVDANGRPARVPAIPLEERDVTWERDTRSRPPMIHVSFEYVREVNLPILDRMVEKQFTVDLSNDLSAPDWGQAR